jgi:hypothetical protein
MRAARVAAMQSRHKKTMKNEKLAVRSIYYLKV